METLEEVHESGTVHILNVGTGDTKLSFSNGGPEELEHAKRVVEDMLKRGYALLVQVGFQDGEPVYQRAKGFDPDTREWIIAGAPEQTIDIGVADKPAKKKKVKNKRIPAAKTSVVAVARTAGG